MQREGGDDWCAWQRPRSGSDKTPFLRRHDGYDIWYAYGMSTDSSPSTASLEIARRLIAREAARTNGSEPRIVGGALQRTCTQVCDALRDSIGEDGCTALLARALARTEAHHPTLKKIRRLNGNGIHVDGVVAVIETSSIVEVTAAIEALLGALVDVLGRLIGDDMAVRIIDYDARSRNGGKPRAS